MNKTDLYALDIRGAEWAKSSFSENETDMASRSHSSATAPWRYAIRRHTPARTYVSPVANGQRSQPEYDTASSTVRKENSNPQSSSDRCSAALRSCIHPRNRFQVRLNARTTSGIGAPPYRPAVGPNQTYPRLVPGDASRRGRQHRPRRHRLHNFLLREPS